MTAQISLDTSKLDEFLMKLARTTSRELPDFIRGQSISIINKTQRSIKNTQRRIKSIRKIYQIPKKLKSGQMKGIIIHRKAREWAERQGAGQYRTRETTRSTWKRIKGQSVRLSKTEKRFEKAKKNQTGAEHYTLQQLAVRRELAMRRSGVGSVRAAYLAALQVLDKQGRSEVSFSKTLRNLKSPDTWLTQVDRRPYDYTFKFSHDGIQTESIKAAIQRGVDRAAADMERHYLRKMEGMLK